MKFSRTTSSAAARFALLALLAGLALGAPAAAQPAVVFTPGVPFPVDSTRPVGHVAGRPLTIQCPGIDATLILWKRADDDGAVHAIWAREVNTTRNPPQLSAERVLVRVPGKSIVDLRLTANWNHYVVAWRTLDTATHAAEMFYRVFDIFLQPVGPATRIAVDTVDPPGKVFVTDGPRAALDDSGRLVVAWLEEIDLFGLGRADQSLLRARRYAFDGALETDVGYGTIEGAKALAMTVAPDGAFLLAWEEDDAEVVEIATRAILQRAGAGTPVVTLFPGDDGFCFHSSRTPAVASTYGSFFLAFADPLGKRVQGGGTDSSCFGLFGQSFDEQGQVTRQAFRIKRNSFVPVVESNRSYYLVTWFGNPPPEPGGQRRPGAYAHPFRPDGQSAGPDFYIQPQEITGIAYIGGDALLVWYDRGVRARLLKGP